MKPRLLLDSNVWVAIVNAFEVERLRFASRHAGLSIVASPAITYEALRFGDRAQRKARVQALTREEWIHPMPEAFQESQELLEAIRRHHPEWLAKQPILNEWYKLQADWKGAWRRRARRDPDAEAAAIKSLGEANLEAAREEASELRGSYQERRIQFDKLTLRESLAFLPEPTPGWDGAPFEPWRAAPMFIWERALANKTGAYGDWLSPWIDLASIRRSDWVRFWTRELNAKEMPLTWLRWAFRHVQATRKTSPGTPVDNQIATYLPNCEYFLTADKIFVACTQVVSTAFWVPIATPVILEGRDVARSLFEFIDDQTRQHSYKQLDHRPPP